MADSPKDPGRDDEWRLSIAADGALDLDAWPRRYWARAFGPFEPRELCGLIAVVAADCGATVTEVHSTGGWWTVVGDHDWIQSSPDEDTRLLECAWPVPGFVNSMRPEFFLRAFAERAVVSRGGELTVLKGRSEGCPLLDESFAARWQRGVSFVPIAARHDDTAPA